MRALHKLFGYCLVLVCLSAAVGCDDDETDDSSASAGDDGTDGSSAGDDTAGTDTDGTSGTEGSSGSSAGAGTDSAEEVTTAQCLADLFEGVDDACAACVCEKDPTIATKCDGSCWGLLDCIGSMCPEPPYACIASTCGALAATGLGGATAVSATIEACVDVCATAPAMTDDMDAGIPDDDAGM